MKDNFSSASGDSITPVPYTSPGVKLKCSYCGKSFCKTESVYTPFCTKRCQQIDLGNWLSESYGLPVEGPEEDFGPLDVEQDDV